MLLKITSEISSLYNIFGYTFLYNFYTLKIKIYVIQKINDKNIFDIFLCAPRTKQTKKTNDGKKTEIILFNSNYKKSNNIKKHIYYILSMILLNIRFSPMIKLGHM